MAVINLTPNQQQQSPINSSMLAQYIAALRGTGFGSPYNDTSWGIPGNGPYNTPQYASQYNQPRFVPNNPSNMIDTSGSTITRANPLANAPMPPPRPMFTNGPRSIPTPMQHQIPPTVVAQAPIQNIGYRPTTGIGRGPGTPYNIG